MADSATSFYSKNAGVIRKRVRNQQYLKVLYKSKRNKLRILRRKRSKLKYRARCRAARRIRETDNLCSEISVFNLNEMYWEQPESDSEEIRAWQNQHQFAYWKSRALAMEYENRMLHKVLRDMQVKQIEEYINYVKGYDAVFPRKIRDRNNKHSTHKYSNHLSKQQICAPPTDQERKEKQERMMALYGNMAPKIGGMETAMKLNYDLYIDRQNPPFWPNIPIRL